MMMMMMKMMMMLRLKTFISFDKTMILDHVCECCIGGSYNIGGEARMTCDLIMIGLEMDA